MNSGVDFETVKTLGLVLPGVEAATRYDGSPVLKLGGRNINCCYHIGFVRISHRHSFAEIKGNLFSHCYDCFC